MTKQEFLEKLKTALSGRVNPEVVTENLRYYEDYINTEVRKGKSEEDVLGALGDPRLIARTIADTNPAPSGARNGGFADETQGDPEGGRWGGTFRSGLSGIPLWMWLVVVIIVAVLVISAVFSILSMILPVLFPILVILFLVKMIRDWRQ